MLFAILAAALGAASPSESTIAGRVVQENGAPAVSAVAVARALPDEAARLANRDAGREEPEVARARAGADGRFRIRVPAGSYELEIRGDGIAPARIEDTVEAGETEDFGDIGLARPVAFSGTVSDSRGKPVADAWVTVVSRPSSEDADWQISTTVRTNASGAFSAAATDRIQSIQAGATAFGPFVETAFRGTIASPASIRLKEGSRVSGKVERPDGSPAAGISVLASQHAVVTGADGTFAISGAAPGHVEVEAVGGGLRGVAAAEEQSRSGLKIRLAPSATLRLNITDSVTRRPIPHAIVTQAGRSVSCSTDRRGIASVENLQPGERLFSVTRRGYVGIEGRRIAVAGGSSSTSASSLALVPMAPLAGRVIDEGNHPISGARITADSPSRRGAGAGGRVSGSTTRAKADGTFSLFADARSGEVDLRASASDFAPGSLPGLRLSPGQGRGKLSIVLSRGFSAKGRVVDEKGAPVAAAIVAYSPAWGSPARGFAAFAGRRAPRDADAPSVASGKDGVFVLSHLKSGSYTLSVAHPSYAGKVVSDVKLDNARHNTIAAIVLFSAAPLAGIVEDSGGRPVPGAEIRARAPAGEDSGASGPDGRFRFAKFANGESAGLMVTAPGYAPAVLSARVPNSNLLVTLKSDGSIRGYVEDASSHDRLQEFQITRKPEAGRGRGFAPASSEALISADGTFLIRNVPPGVWTFEASASSYEPQSLGGIQVSPGETTDDVVFSMKAGARVSGSVVDDSTGQPIPGALVEWQAAGSSAPTGAMRFGAAGNAPGSGSVSTDANGSFVLDGLPAREHVTMTAQEYNHLPASADATAGGDTEVVIRMGSGSVISGRLVDGRGNGVPGGTIALGELGGSLRTNATSTADASGNFEFDHESPGTYELTGHSGDQNSPPQQVALVQGQNATGILLSLSGGASIMGHVTGLSAQDLAQVGVTASSGSGFSGSATPDATGAYEIDGAPPGTVRVTARTSGAQGRTVTQSAEIPEGSSQAQVDLAFPADGGIHGTVTRGGQPQAQIFIAAQPETPGGTPTSGRAQSDASGSYAIAGLEDGDYVVRAGSLSGGAASAPFEQTVTVSGDTPLDIDLPSISISGVVTEQGASDPVAAASVSLDNGGATTAFAMPRVATDSIGNFRIDGMASGDYRISISKSGWQTLTQPLSISDSTSALSYSMTRAEGITIHANDAQTGTPLPQIEALFMGSDGSIAFQGTVALDATGRGEIPQLPPGSDIAYFFARGYAPLPIGAITIPSPPLMVGMTQGGELDIRASGETAGVTASLATESGLPYLMSPVRFDPQFSLVGAVTALAHVAPGPYILTVGWPGGPKTYSVQVPPTGATSVTVP